MSGVRTIASFTIYHSPNAYIGSVLLRRAAEKRNEITIERRPIYVPRERGVLVSEMLGGRENANAGSYNREDCERWARRYGIPLASTPSEVFFERMRRWSEAEFGREELAARAYYAAVGSGHEDALDHALFEAAWVAGLDVNESATVSWAAERAGLDGAALLAKLREEEFAEHARAALAEFDRHECPGVPTFVVDGQRYFGKDRVDWALGDVGCFTRPRTASAAGRQERPAAS